jgi:hypothetical protein
MNELFWLSKQCVIHGPKEKKLSRRGVMVLLLAAGRCAHEKEGEHTLVILLGSKIVRGQSSGR